MNHGVVDGFSQYSARYGIMVDALQTFKEGFYMEKKDVNLNHNENSKAPERKLLFFSRNNMQSVVAAKPTGSAVIFNPKTNKWDYSDKDYFQIVSDTNYDQISEAEAKNVYGEYLPQFGFLDVLDILKRKRLEESKNND